ncbi:hypothetical protein SO694_00015156 [Aureococcus anophagefferens]|uniref:Prolyl 4-hydroxylase alpha subunit Fe(2+) 2OG dioxygenase domain-containing protein n=1 Tax=Aureococcus anophagefferens TaxID=44056 RepID=A0ABR1G2B6_AURAN
MGCACPDQAKALLSNELHREWGTTAAKYARYLISGLKFVDGTWTSKARALSHRLEDDARRLADRAALATLTTNLRCDGQGRPPAATWLGSPSYGVVEPADGVLVVFPGGLKHAVFPDDCAGPRPRVSISFNVAPT